MSASSTSSSAPSPTEASVHSAGGVEVDRDSAKPTEAGWPPGAGLASDAIVRAAGSSFTASFVRLPKDQRAGMRTLYAFCRVADDAVDDAPDAVTGRRWIGFWREELERIFEDGLEPRTDLGNELASTVERFGIESRHLFALVEGMESDLTATEFETVEDVDEYCYHAASTVGLASLSIFGVAGSVAETFAEQLGKALQWINVLRDLHTDAKDGRVYAPRAWLKKEGIEVDWLRGEGPPDAFAANGPIDKLVDRLGDEAERRLDAARRAHDALPSSERRKLDTPRAMAQVYRELLRRLRVRGGAICDPPMKLSRGRKLWLIARSLVRRSF